MGDVYEMNVPRNTELDCQTFLLRVVCIESKLETWKKELPVMIGVRTSKEILQNLAGTSDISRFSTVLTLRYLNARTLLHRAVLTRFLDSEGQNMTANADWVLLRALEKTSLDLSVSSAVEMIEIHQAMSNSCQRMLTTWWFSLYYGTPGQCFRQQGTSLIFALVFSSALVLFAAMIVHHGRGIHIQAFENQDIMSVFQSAFDALEHLGHQSRMANRCRKYLEKLLHVAKALGKCKRPPLISIGMMYTELIRSDAELTSTRTRSRAGRLLTSSLRTI